MHLALLMTNTDQSEFAQQHPEDSEKFASLIKLVRPDWTLTSYSVKDDVFPEDISQFDGFLISGSPASVFDKTPWTARLQTLIKAIHAQNIPMFGTCYGHQAIALALGGTVGPNPSGWVFGMTTSDVIAAAPWMTDLPSPFHQYGAHIEAVTTLPDGAEILTVSEACQITGFRISDTVYTTQNHPEMTADFVAALIDEYRDKLPASVGDIAARSLTHKVDRRPYAETIAQFFEARLAN